MAAPKIIADFETQLATALAVGGTSFTLSSATDDDGVALPTGKYYFTIDNGTSAKEYVVGTLTGTSVASVSNVSRQGTETSGVLRAHRVGASVIMTDFLTYKNYIDETTVAGAADADTNTKGVVETATLAEVRARTGTGGTGAALVLTPDVCDDLPTADEKAALAGGGDLGTPDTNNKFLTEDFANNAVRTVYEFADSPATFTKKDTLKRVRVQLWAGGGSGGRTNVGTEEVGGGGGGGYNEWWFEASELGATETITIGAGGAAITSNGAGAAGENTTFGSLLTAFGGGAGGYGSSGAGGGGGGGPISAGGSASGATPGTAGTPGEPLAGAGGASTAVGNSGLYGAGGGGNGRSGGSAYYGGGGGSGASSGSGEFGGTSVFGGDGGDASIAASGNAESGQVPGGGGGAKYNSSGSGNSGAGGAGRAIVTEFYA